ncbi:TraU family protein [Arcobacter lanthieri]|uniref:TraU family protein n=1 Tax=Aliarcobacter lanthieri TaxID=1355374 RepID=UPI001924D51A|nr:TraU family protein [Aliarcobacter lanthieri]MBL3518875.1 TraU family protein [Aliarcobacter lanthieri]
MKKLIFIFLIFMQVNLFAVCAPTGALTVDIILKADYTAMFPLRIAGIPIVPGRIQDVGGSVSSPICICKDPIPRIGIPVSFFEPSRLIEVVKDPYCFPSMGFGLTTSGGALGGTSGDDGSGNQSTFYQAHYYIFPIYALLELLTDFICLQMTGFDMAYLTEVDPLWNNDTLSAIINPEALLFGNPVANLACIADAVTSAVFEPIDALFWCKGSWGNAYPLTGQTGGDGYVEGSASVAASLIYKLHRQLVLWGSWGQAGLCGYYPAPIWRKSAYRLQIVTPIPSLYATTIGTTGMLWSFGKNPPFVGDNFSYLLFKKRECCAF